MNGTFNSSTAWPFFADQVQNYAWWEDAFTAEECEKIKSIGLSKSASIGKVGSNDGYQVKDEYRNSEISWIFPDDESSWIYRRLTDIVGNLNAKYFGFDVYGFVEGLQFSTYKPPSGKYDLHIDKAINQSIRKLSVVLLLSDENDYVGGDFKIKTGKTEDSCPRKQGTLLVFPSYVLHGVTEVTSGTRNSLVGWITGPAFR